MKHLGINLSDEYKQMLQFAADLLGKSMTEYVQDALLHSMERTFSHKIQGYTDYAILVSALTETPVEPAEIQRIIDSRKLSHAK